MERVVRWRSLEGDGLEHLHLSLGREGIVADALVIGGESQPFGLRYRLSCDPAWRVREAVVALVGAGREIRLSADGQGNWLDGAGAPVSALDGCLDIDIAATPFTNTLPIRRLGLAPGEGRDIRVAYIPAPELEPFPVGQRYTRLGVQSYRYEGFPPGFSADITVDADGLVVEYPGLFRRVA